MLNQVKEKNSQMFVDHFNEVFGGKFNVECEWGFPVMMLQLSTKEESITVRWRLSIDVTKPDYTLQTFASKLEGEVEVPQFATIDRAALEFIVGRSMMLSNNLFPQETTETEATEEPTTEDPS
jgi:hypothetical protein